MPHPPYTRQQASQYTSHEMVQKERGISYNIQYYWRVLWVCSMGLIGSLATLAGDLSARWSAGIIASISLITALMLYTQIKLKRRIVITAHKQEEDLRDTAQQLQHSQKKLEIAKDRAEVANQAKSDFLANMSHEIRTPLNSMIGMVEILLNEELSPTHRNHLLSIYDSSSLLLSLINDILDLSKVEAGELTIERTEISLSLLVGQIISLIEIQANERGLDVRLEYETALPQYVLTDPIRLRQILLNLLGNAVKFTSHGHILLQVQCHSISDSEVSVRFAVHDTGMGISQEKQAHIFNKFSQADSSTTRRFGGSGLGLSIAEKLVTKMGGALNVKSQPGVGSCFYFHLPFGLLEQEPSLRAKKMSEDSMIRMSPALRLDLGAAPLISNISNMDSASQKSYHIAKHFNAHLLVVEDFPPNQRMAKIMLEKMGCTVTLANDGEEALDILEDDASRFDLVLMDCQMPVMDGFETTQHIRKQPWGNKVIIIAMTANALAGAESECHQAGMDDYISKPIHIAEISDMLTRHLPATKVIPVAQQAS